MRSTPTLLLAVTATFGLCALRCGGGDETLLSGAGGTGNAIAGRAGTSAGTAGGGAGSGGSTAGTASSGGASGAGSGGTAGNALGVGGFSGSLGTGSLSGAPTVVAGAGGLGGAGAGGASAGASGFGGAGAGGLGGIGSTAGTAGASSGGGASGGAGPSPFQPVADIIAKSCATDDCHVNMKKQHSNLHNTDGMLYERLLSTTTTIVGAKDVCAKDPLVVPGNPDASLLIKMIIADDAGRKDCGKRMPYDCPDEMAMTVCLTDPQIQVIRDWIAAGALR